MERPGNYLLGGWWGTTLWSTVLFLQRCQGEEEEENTEGRVIRIISWW